MLTTRTSLRTRLRNQERGFTLIELVVVVLIIGILATIAIAAFSVQQGKAKEAAMKSDVRNMATAVINAYVRDGKYPSDHRTISTPVASQPEFRNDVKFSEGNKVSYYVYADENDLTKTFAEVPPGTKPGFCVFVSNPTIPDIRWRWLSSDGKAVNQTCPVKVLEATEAP